MISYLYIVIIFISGLISIYEVIETRNKKIGEIIEKILPYRGHIGGILIIFAVWTSIRYISFFETIFDYMPVTSILYLCSICISFSLGLIFLLDLFRRYSIISEKRYLDLEKNIKEIKIPLGFAAIIFSFYLFLWSIFHWNI